MLRFASFTLGLSDRNRSIVAFLLFIAATTVSFVFYASFDTGFRPTLFLAISTLLIPLILRTKGGALYGFACALVIMPSSRSFDAFFAQFRTDPFSGDSLISSLTYIVMILGSTVFGGLLGYLRVLAEKEYENRKATRKFVAMVFHELRTPLMVVQGYLELFAESHGSEDPETLRKRLAIMQKQLNRCQRLISDLGFVQRIQEGSFSLEKQSVDFCAFIEEELESIKLRLGDQFHVEPCETPANVHVCGDLDRLSQVLRNVVDNAMKHTNTASRRIWISRNVTSEWVQINVSDNGAGIPSDQIDNVFSAFSSFPSEFGSTGTGLGLFLSRSIIEDHGGEIWQKAKEQAKRRQFASNCRACKRIANVDAHSVNDWIVKTAQTKQCLIG